MSLLSKLKRTIKLGLRRAQAKKALRRNFQLDYDRFDAWGCPDRQFHLPAQREAYILMLAHAVEKGLAFENRRLWFGEVKICDLIRQCRQYAKDSKDRWVIGVSTAVLRAYLGVHEGEACEKEEFKNLIEAFLEEFEREDSEIAGGLKTITLPTGVPAGGEVTNFFQTRCSVRSFADQPVDRALLNEAVRLAQSSPSVCNRQTARVHAIDGQELQKRALACQNGNAGFGHLADKVVTITVDLRCFLSIGERNQAWIDGGLFAMTLIWALHSLGLVSCSLNWSAEHEQDQQLRDVLPLGEHEVVIMMLAVGHPPKELKVPCSERRPLDTILTWHE
ncbi:MAG: nitroreductase family protein [Limisphaerales bacterium]